MVISLETAKKLRAAGLVWEPKRGDMFHDEGINRFTDTDSRSLSIITRVNGNSEISCVNISLNQYNMVPRGGTIISTWLPRFDQVRDRIRALGWDWQAGPGWFTAMRYHGRGDGLDKWAIETFRHKDDDEAAAEALLWILEREKNCCAG